MEKVKGIKWRKHIKRLVLSVGILSVIGVAGAGLAYSFHQTQEEKVIAAENRLIETQAKEKNIKLISESDVRKRVGNAIGVPESDISFNRIRLTEKDNKDTRDKKRYKGYYDDFDDIDDIIERKIKNKLANTANISVDTPDAMTSATKDNTVNTTIDNSSINEVIPQFKPKYSVKCTANGVNYKIILDAVTGEILFSKVSDRF